MTPATAAKPRAARIVVALEADTPRAQWLLEAAAALAQEMSAELFAIFVENADFFRAASLPGVRIIGASETAEIMLDAASLDRHLKQQAKRLRDSVERTARKHGLIWHLDIRRGTVSEEILASVGRGDILAISASSRTHRRSRLGSTARIIAEKANCDVLIVNAETGRAGSITRFDTSTEQGNRLCRILARLTGLSPEICEPQDTSQRLARLRSSRPGYLIVQRSRLTELGIGMSQLLTEAEPTGVFILGDPTDTEDNGPGG